MTFRKPRRPPNRASQESTLLSRQLFAPHGMVIEQPKPKRRAKIEDGGAVGEIEMDGEKYER